METLLSRRSSERGAVVIHVAVFLLSMLAFTSFVVDYGVMWVSRGQAQTSADAGALAAAISIAYDDPDDFDGAKLKAKALAEANTVWGRPPDVQVATDVTFLPCPPGAPGVPDTCVKVDVYRNQERGNALPMFFGNLVGVASQGVRATATAQIVGATSSECLRPWAVIDRWDEYDMADGVEAEYGTDAWDPQDGDPDFLPTSTFDRYSDGQGQSPPQENDLYVPPTDTSAGTGYTHTDNPGWRFAVKADSNTNSTVSPGWFRAIRIPRLDGGTGGSVYRDNIEGCGGLPTSYWIPEYGECPDDIGNDNREYWAARGCFGTEPGNMVGPTRQGVETVVNRDDGAEWVGGTVAEGGYIEGSAFPPGESPRIVPIGVIDIDHFMSQDPSGSNGVLKLVGIFGFFIEGMGDVDEDTGEMTCCSNGGKAVIGRLVSLAGNNFSPRVTSFLRTVILVR
jgi:hypothetical protein